MCVLADAVCGSKRAAKGGVIASITLWQRWLSVKVLNRKKWYLRVRMGETLSERN